MVSTQRAKVDSITRQKLFGVLLNFLRNPSLHFGAIGVSERAKLNYCKRHILAAHWNVNTSILSLLAAKKQLPWIEVLGYAFVQIQKQIATYTTEPAYTSSFTASPKYLELTAPRESRYETYIAATGFYALNENGTSKREFLPGAGPINIETYHTSLEVIGLNSLESAY